MNVKLKYWDTNSPCSCVQFPCSNGTGGFTTWLTISTIELFLYQLNPVFKLTPFLQDPFVFVSAFECGMFTDGPLYRTTVFICIVQTSRQTDNRLHVLTAMWQHWALHANWAARVLCDFPAMLQSRMCCGHCRKPRDVPSGRKTLVIMWHFTA